MILFGLRLCAALLVLICASPASAQSKVLNLDDASIADLQLAMSRGSLTSEKLVKMYLERIRAFDRAGPSIHALITINPRALATARALDTERKLKGPRSPLHGIPVILKDSIDTEDMPTTAGSVLLEGSIPLKDATIVAKLKAAGAIILAKANMSEFGRGSDILNGSSSLGGITRNPHELTHTPAGSSSGTGAGVAALFGAAGVGTDSWGSVRLPASANGIVGLRPTLGLISRDGIIPLARSLDTPGPMARSVSDAAILLDILAGRDDADPATAQLPRSSASFSASLRPGGLAGARIGVARDFMGADADVDWVVESALSTMRAAGATIVDVRFPSWLLTARFELVYVIRRGEFRPQLETYLRGLRPGFPSSMSELVARAEGFNARRADGALPNSSLWARLRDSLQDGGSEDYAYIAVRKHMLPLVRDIVDGLLTSQRLDAIVYPTDPRRTAPLAGRLLEIPPTIQDGAPIASLAGVPDLVVPAGFTADGLPVGISFLGRELSEPTLLRLGFSYEQLSKARRLPAQTPKLPGEVIRVPTE